MPNNHKGAYVTVMYINIGAWCTKDLPSATCPQHHRSPICLPAEKDLCPSTCAKCFQMFYSTVLNSKHLSHNKYPYAIILTKQKQKPKANRRDRERKRENSQGQYTEMPLTKFLLFRVNSDSYSVWHQQHCNSNTNISWITS